MSKTDGTYMNFPPGLREVLDLVIMGVEAKRTQWVTELVEDEVVDILSAMPYDVGVTLDNLHPGKNMMVNYKALLDRVHQRRTGVAAPPVVIPEDIEEEELEELDEVDLIDSNVINSITDLS